MKGDMLFICCSDKYKYFHLWTKLHAILFIKFSSKKDIIPLFVTFKKVSLSLLQEEYKDVFEKVLDVISTRK